MRKMKRKKNILLICSIFIIGLFALIGCGNSSTTEQGKENTEKTQEKSEQETKETKETNENLPIVTMKIKDYGTIELEFH